MKNLLTLLLLAGIFAQLPCFGQRYAVGDTLWVSALRGLNMRAAPSARAAIVSLLAYGSPVSITAERPPNQTIEIGGVYGHWVEVSTAEHLGFVFDAYLASMPVLELPGSAKADTDLLHQVRKYALGTIGALDSVSYCNGVDGESYHRMEIYTLRNGHQFVDHAYYESYCYELQLKGVSRSEGLQFVKNLIEVSGMQLPQIIWRPSDYYTSWFQIDGELCCTATMRDWEGSFILVLCGGP